MNVGITERGDAGIDFSWSNKLLDANIIISKNINDTLINLLIKNKEKIIFHITCTGYGGTILEPNVRNVEWTYLQISKLINGGFPVNQIVLRIDPIIPTHRGIATAKTVLDHFYDTDIKRVRYSFLDMYPHVKKRFIDLGIKIPYESFCAPQDMISKAMQMLENYEDRYEFEACAENTKHQLGCISKKDFDILGINEQAKAAGYQRPGCLCVAGKTELLNNKTRCPHQCLYCYWKD